MELADDIDILKSEDEPSLQLPRACHKSVDLNSKRVCVPVPGWDKCFFTRTTNGLCVPMTFL